MKDIICPKCSTTFKVDEASIADIAKQVRDDQFDQELNVRMALLEKEKESALKLVEATVKNSMQENISKNFRLPKKYTFARKTSYVLISPQF